LFCQLLLLLERCAVDKAFREDDGFGARFRVCRVNALVFAI